jgi:hypothetical protein
MRVRTLLATAVIAVSAAGAGVAWTGAASADTLICDQYGTTTVGNYIAQNDAWGASTPTSQCINVTSTGFSITRQDDTSWAVHGYPSMYLGCHYGACSPNSPLPKQISGITSATSSISNTYVDKNSNNDTAAYDIWLDPTAKTDGVNKTEIMIWLDHNGGQPVGSSVGNVTVGGKTWDLWIGNNGGNDVLSYVAPSAISSLDFSVLDFVKDTINHGYATDSWYLTSIQAGFETWNHGAGLAVDSFGASVS